MRGEPPPAKNLLIPPPPPEKTPPPPPVKYPYKVFISSQQVNSILILTSCSL